jgi:hypothetical protein
MKERQDQTVRKPANRLRKFARERADKEARRIPWQRLFEARNQYIDWQEFYLWVRSILEVEDRVPDWLVTILNDRIPRFLENEKQLAPKTAKGPPLPLRLEDWIDGHVFGFAKHEGWFNALTFYAIREPRYHLRKGALSFPGELGQETTELRRCRHLQAVPYLARRLETQAPNPLGRDRLDANRRLCDWLPSQ